jgi:Ca2+-binding RTX toxin-like protein
MEDLIGTNGDDTLVGSSGGDAIFGLDGNDELFGEDGRDTLSGGAGNDLLDGSGGNAETQDPGDLLRGGLGNDTLLGHQDHFNSGREGAVVSYADIGGIGGVDITVTDNFIGSGTVVSRSGNVINDVFQYSRFFQGSADADVIRGGTTMQTGFAGLRGNDTLIGGSSDYDFLQYNDDRYEVGGGGAVTVNFLTGQAIDGFGDTDTFSGMEQVRGSEQGDTFIGSARNERMLGVGGNDTMLGGDGNDTLDGGGGNDRLDGDGGNDTLFGGDGTDTLIGGEGDDFLYGGATEADLRDVMFGGAGNDTLDAGWGNDELNGGAGNDMLDGGFGSDTLIGNDGNDMLSGGAGSDLMFGGPGNDTLNGGWGFDRMNGGAGADRFFHVGVADHGSDWVQDYNAAEGDVLVFGLAGATRAQFQVNINTTPGAGAADVAEAFVVYRPTGQIMWALVDGDGQDSINIQLGGTVFDLME